MDLKKRLDEAQTMIEDLQKARTAVRKASNEALLENIGIGSISSAGLVRVNFGIERLAEMLGVEMRTEDFLDARWPKFDGIMKMVDYGGLFFTQEVSRQAAASLRLMKDGDRK